MSPPNRSRLLHQPVERRHRVAAVVRMQAKALAHGDQHLRDRVMERPLAKFEPGIGAGAGLARRVTRDQPADHRQAGPGICRQVRLADPVRRLRRAARQRDLNDQRRRARAVPQPKLGLQGADAVVIRHLSTAAASAGPTPSGRGCRPRRRRAAGRRPPSGSRRPAFRRRAGPTAGRPGSAPVRPGSWCGPARRTRRLRSFSDRVGVLLPPETLTVSRDPAGTDTGPPCGLQENRRDTGVCGGGDPGLQLGRRRVRRRWQRTARQRRTAGRGIEAGDGEAPPAGISSRP